MRARERNCLFGARGDLAAENSLALQCRRSAASFKERTSEAEVLLMVQRSGVGRGQPCGRDADLFLALF